ncbi:MAG: CBS domain-containing protein [Gemmatimonadaceae bacterium]
MKVKDIMTASPACCSPSDSLRDAARIMRDSDCGAVPVVENDRVVGIITDRDLAVRAVAEGKSADSKVSDVLTRDPRCCSEDADVDEVAHVMKDSQVRRVPIVDAKGKCVGIVSQADLARAAKDGSTVSDREVGIVVERISEPASGSGKGSTGAEESRPAE